MQRLHDLNRSQVLERQALSPARVYATDRIQQVRIQYARQAVKEILLKLKSAYVSTAHTMRTIVELGANSCDISGHFSMGHMLHAWEISPKCVEFIVRNYPWVQVHAEDIESATPIACDILILCEILEHLTDPEEVVKKWLPNARYAVISSPLKGDRDGDLSGGEHVFSFDPEDFTRIPILGGHIVLSEMSFPMGAYTIKFMVTQRKD